MENSNILITGGAGFIGKPLSIALHRAGHSVTVVSRRPVPAGSLQPDINFIQADITTTGPWQQLVQDFDVIINLAGVSIFRRWTTRGKQQILESRISSARNLVDALRAGKGKTERLFNVSGVGYYGFHGDETLTEYSPGGSDFLARVALQWEEEAGRARELGIRPLILRLGHVLGTGGGIMPKLIILAKLHLAGRWGSGEQWISWIHEKDLARCVLFLLDNQSVSGPVNITSPNPVRNREMMLLLNKMLGREPFLSYVPESLLRLLTGEFASVFFNGQRVIPEILQHRGFNFEFPHLSVALESLLRSSGLMYNENISCSKRDSG